MKKEFIDYIATESSAPNSAKNYTSGLNAISKIIGTDIFRITNPKEIKDIIQELKENNKFIELDKHNNMYSNAIKHYLKFLESKKTEKISQNEDISLNELQILLTKELLQTVINNEPNVSYKELADRVTKAGMLLHHRHVGKNIGEVSKLCFKLGLPMLSAKVMNQDSHIAGEGFFDLYKELHSEIKGDPRYIFKKELEKIRNCNEWYKLTEYLGIEIEGIDKPRILDDKINDNTDTAAIEDLLEQYEGEIKERTYLSRSRNRQVVSVAKQRDNYTCIACKFSYENKIVEAHHLIPINEKDAGTITANELITLCPTCHSLAHVLLKNDSSYQNKEKLIAKLQEIQYRT